MVSDWIFSSGIYPLLALVVAAGITAVYSLLRDYVNIGQLPSFQRRLVLDCAAITGVFIIVWVAFPHVETPIGALSYLTAVGLIALATWVYICRAGIEDVVYGRG